MEKNCQIYFFGKNTEFAKYVYQNQIESNLSLYSLYHAEACNEFAGPISASLRTGNTAPFEEMSQRWRAIGNTVSDLTGPRFELRTSCSRDKCIRLDQLAYFENQVLPRYCYGKVP